MSVVKQWAAEIERFAPSLRVLSHHGVARLKGDGLVEGALASRRRRHVLRHRDAGHRDAGARRVGSSAARRGAGHQEPGDEAGARVAPRARPAARRDDRHADREPARRAVGDHGHRQSRAARPARLVRPHVRAADRGHSRRREGAGALARDRAAVRAAPGEGRAGGRARAAADHDREGLLPADGRAGEPLSGDGRPLDAADRGAARQLRPARVGARDAEPAEARVQPPGAAAADRGRRWTAAPGSSTGSSSCSSGCRQGDKALVFTQYPGFDRLVPHLAEHARRSASGSSTGGSPRGSATTCCAPSRRRTARRCS